MLEKQRCLSNIIETRGLSKTFNGRIVLDNIDLNIPRGSIFALIRAQWCRQDHFDPYLTGPI